MGYRLELYELKKQPICCLGKLYGYYDEENLQSHQWLVKKGYVNKNQLYLYGCSVTIVINGYDLKQFLDLYIEDYNKHNIFSNKLHHSLLDEIDDDKMYILELE